ncbi:hypothetical protein IAR50_004337 [Cryptococcus sp. DSM 104548]
MAPALPPDGKIPCPTQRHLIEELEELAYALEPAEKEDTWEKFEKAIIRFAAVVRGGGYKFTETFVEGVGRGGVGTKLVRCMLSDRGRLSGVATDLLQTFAPRLSTHFKPLTHLYLEPIITLLGRPNKVYLRRTEKCLATIISNCHLPVIVQELRKGLDDNAAACRKGCAVAIDRALQEWPYELWNDKWLKMLEECVRKMGADKDPQVRETGREVLSLFAEAWPERVDDFASPLTPITRRNLKIDANGAAAKPKARPVAPARKVPAPLSSSTTSSSSVHPPAPHHRVQELGGSKFPPVQQPAAAPLKKWSGDEPQASQATYDPKPQRIHAEPLPLQSGESSRPRAHHALPPARHMRTISHDSIPIHSSSNPNPNSLFSPDSLPQQSYQQKYNPLSKPVRPALPASLSTSALLPQGESVNAKPRRMAPPERIVKPVVEEGDEEEAVGLATGSGSGAGGALRGAVRPALGKKNTMGQATRRVVTAPLPLSSESTSTLENLPPTRPRPQVSAESFFSPIPSRVVEQEKKNVESPLMPVLIQSTSSKVDVEEVKHSHEESEGVIDMEEDVYPSTPSKRASEDARREVEVAKEVALPESPAVEKRSTEMEGEVEKTECESTAPDVAQRPTVESRETEVVTNGVQPAAEPASGPTSAPPPPIQPAFGLAAKPSRPQVAPTAKPLSRPPARPVPAASRAQPEPKPAAPPRKPPVPRVRVASGTKPPVPVVRRAFKPTSSTSAGSSAVQPPAPAPTTRAVSNGSAGVANRPVAASATAKAAQASASIESKPVVTAQVSAPPARSNPVSSSRPEASSKPPASFGPISKPPTKPPASSSSASAPKATIAPRPRKPAVPSHNILPAAKKEKIRLKAPLPSFRPMRAKREVKPEAVPLPESPPKAAAIPLPPSPHASPQDHPLPPSPPRSPTPRTHTPSLSKPSPLRTEMMRARADSPARSIKSQRSTRSVPPSPGGMALDKGRPASPLLTRGDAMPALVLETAKERDEPEQTVEEGASKEEREDNDAELKEGEAGGNADIFGSVSGCTLETQTATASAPKPQQKIDGEDRVEREMAAATASEKQEESSASQSFNTPSVSDTPVSLTPPATVPCTRTPSPLLSPLAKTSIPAFATRIEVSTPGKSALSLLAKLEGREGVATPERERKALAVKDANSVGTPHFAGAEGGFEGDVSA